MTRHWHADPTVTNQLIEHCRSQNYRFIIDIGSNPKHRFPLASTTVGWEADHVLDLCRHQLPFSDGSVDFVYCRHTIEDLANPEFLLSEIRRVARAGYIECPSPLVETSRRMDACGSHMGFVHHRWVVYSHASKLTCLAKYPCIERMPVQDYGEMLLQQETPDLWQTRHYWQGELEYEVIQQEQGMNMGVPDDLGMFPMEYLERVKEACELFMETAK